MRRLIAALGLALLAGSCAAPKAAPARSTWPYPSHCPACGAAWRVDPPGTPHSFRVTYPDEADALARDAARLDAVAEPFRHAGLEATTSPGGTNNPANRMRDARGDFYPDIVVGLAGVALAMAEVETAEGLARRGPGCTPAGPCRNSRNCTPCQWWRYVACTDAQGRAVPFHVVVPVGSEGRAEAILGGLGLLPIVPIWTWTATDE